MITQKELKSILKYNRSTGLFTWKIEKAKCAKKGSIAGSLHKENGYIQIRLNNKLYKAHRLAWLYVNGEMPVEQIDHKNHNRSDNRFKNLRSASNKINHKNRTKPKDNTSGVVGVYWKKSTKRWCASIRVDYKNKHLGYFANFSEAVDARKNAEVLYGFYENHGK